jgi:hypothetical protein
VDVAVRELEAVAAQKASYTPAIAMTAVMVLTMAWIMPALGRNDWVNPLPG